MMGASSSCSASPNSTNPEWRGIPPGTTRRTSASRSTTLDERYAAGEGAEHAHVLRGSGRWHAAIMRDDRPAMLAAMAPDYTMADHRSLGYDAVDRASFIEQALVRTEVARDDVTVNRLLRVIGDALLVVQDQSWITSEGSDYERRSCVVVAVDGAGLVRRAEWFDEDGYDEALARLDELGAPEPRTVLDNAARRSQLDFVTALDAYLRSGDMSALVTLAAESTDDFVLEDHRAIVAMPDQDRRSLEQVYATMRAQGYARAHPTHRSRFAGIGCR